VDMPNEPAESNFKNKVRAVAYPCVERNGMIWSYLGPRPTPPPLPDLEANMMPEGEWAIRPAQQECNYLQVLEGDLDTVHGEFLHRGSVKLEETQPGTMAHYLLWQRHARFSVVETSYGAMYSTYRPAEPGHTYHRLGHYLMPFYAMPPGGVLGYQITTIARVPMDDAHTMSFYFRTPTRGTRVQPGGGQELRPNTTDWFGRWRTEGRAENDFGLDRELQRKNEGWFGYSGIPGVQTQDRAVTESMGTTYDRTNERLGTSDSMIIRVRRKLIDSAKALAEHGLTPYTVDHPEAYRVRPGGLILPDEADWVKETEVLRQAFTEHPELDLSIAGGE